MIPETHKTTEIYNVTFSPTAMQIAEIEDWLIAEQKKSREGFYCNWDIIKSSFENKELAAISLNNKTVGFATWSIDEKKAKIIIAEVQPKYRKTGVGRRLTTDLLNFLNEKGVLVVDLQCSPETSEPIWKRLGFMEFPDAPHYNFNVGGEKCLYMILVEHLQPSADQLANETIELWDDEPYRTDVNATPTYIWKIDFIEGTRKLLKPIIHPGSYHWRLRWKINGETIIDDKIKYFGTDIDHGGFIIIQELPLSIL